MARRSRFEGYLNVMKGRAEKPALYVKDRLSQMKEKVKNVNRKPEKEGK